WGASETLLLGAGSLVLLALFGLRESRAKSPLMPLRLLRSRPLLAANGIQIVSVAGMFGMFFLGALYLRRVLGYDPLQIGFAFLPVCVAMGTLSVRYSERIVMRLGARTALLSGLPLIALSLVLIARVPVHASYVADVLPSMALLGIGAGIAFPALMNAAMAGATPQDAGLASGLVNTTAQVGGALGLAVLATLSASHSKALAHGGAQTKAILTSGYHLAFWIAAALVLTGIALSAFALEGKDTAGATVDASFEQRELEEELEAA
ncbi:MAG TPA: MFS transporter, partial [Solirubrobacteraceae bacterium]